MRMSWKESEKALKEHKEFAEKLIQNSAVPTFVLDKEHRVIIWNKACEELTGMKAEELIGTDDHWKAFYAYKRPCLADIVLDGKLKDLSVFYSIYSKSSMVSEGLQSEGWFPKLGGKDRYIFFDAAPIRDSKGEIIAVIETLQDITERKRAEEKVIKLNRLYSILSEINHLIVRICDEREFFENICRILVEQGLFRMAWIGLVDEKPDLITPVAHYGFEDGYLDNIIMCVDGSSPLSQGPTGVAARQGVHSACNNIENDPRMLPWRDEAVKRGFRSLAAFPLKSGTKVIGVLNVYASTADYFGVQEVQVLNKYAADISFALEYLRQQALRQKAEASLARSRDFYLTLFEEFPALIWRSGLDARCDYFNKSWLDFTGRTLEQELGDGWTEGIHPEDLARRQKTYLDAFNARQPFVMEYRLRRYDGEYRWIIDFGRPYQDLDGNFAGYIGACYDITERKLAEKILFEKNKRVQKELQLAGLIQSSLFPMCLPQVPRTKLAAVTVPAYEVGGDYCDLFVGKNERLVIAIGDVMGKGVPAALFVALTYAFVRNYSSEIYSPGILLKAVNRGLFYQLDFSQQFITLFYGAYDPAARELVYANAGHNPPVVYRAATGECEILQVKNFILGGRYDAEFREGRCSLDPGDIVLFYTDGLKEGRNMDKERFGIQRVIRLLKENCMLAPPDIQEIIMDEFYSFIGDEPLQDDISMIIMKIT